MGLFIMRRLEVISLGVLALRGGDDTGAYSSGIKFQGAASPTLLSCIGHGGSANSGGIYVDYNCEPLLNSCIGFSGKNDGAYSLRIANRSSARVVNGHYGPTKLVSEYIYANATKKFQLDTSKPYRINGLTLWVNVARAGVTVNIGTTLGGTEIASGLSLNTASVQVVTITKRDIIAGEFIYLTPSSALTDGDITINAFGINNNAIKAAFLDSAGAFSISSAVFTAPPAGSGIYLASTTNSNTDFYLDKLDIICKDETKNAIECQSAFTSLPLTNSKIKGVISGVTSYLDTAISGSSNYR